MKQTLEAVYENGVFRPLSSPRIEDGQPVHLELETRLGGHGGVDAEECRDPQPAWLTPILQRLSALLQLPPGWDSYTARSVRPECAVFALGKVLPAFMRLDLPVPSVVPTNSGGLQLEWHTRGVDLEVEISQDNRVFAVYELLGEAVEWEGEVALDLAELEAPLSRLTRSESAPT